MGYPMTYQRVIHRNGLYEGDYDHLPPNLSVHVNLDNKGLVTQDEFDKAMVDHYRERLRQYERTTRMLLGDLRRLEVDAVDEQATAQAVAHRTGIDAETVAAVLKEFMAW
jgi:hypothetical protein